eukprot:jgi/Mesen1/9923/ME000070S09206
MQAAMRRRGTARSPLWAASRLAPTATPSPIKSWRVPQVPARAAVTAPARRLWPAASAAQTPTAPRAPAAQAAMRGRATARSPLWAASRLAPTATPSPIKSLRAPQPPARAAAMAPVRRPLAPTATSSPIKSLRAPQPPARAAATAPARCPWPAASAAQTPTAPRAPAAQVMVCSPMRR